MRRTEIIYIYLLIDPRNGEPFYVGQTQNPAQRRRLHTTDGNKVWRVLKRASQMKQDPWCYKATFENRSLREQRLALITREKLRPILQLVEFTTAYYSVECEQYWMDKLRAEGWVLTNADSARENVHVQRIIRQDSA